MEPAHVFYNELPLDENNVFTAKLTKTMKLKKLSLKSQIIMQLAGFQLTKK